MSDPNLRKLARLVAGAPAAPTPYVRSLAPRHTRGLVTALNPNGGVWVVVDGSPSATPADVLAHVAVQVGSVVELHQFGTRQVVDGTLASTGQTGGGFVTGDIKMSGSTTYQPGWLLLDGSIYQTAIYPALATWLVSQGWGSVGSTFAMPDSRGRCPVGISPLSSNGQPTIGAFANTYTVAGVVAGQGGEALHTLGTTEMPVHNHPDPGHSHPVFPGANLAYQALASSLYAYTGGGSPITFEIGGLTGGATTGIQNAGGGGAHNNMPPFIGVALFMKT